MALYYDKNNSPPPNELAGGLGIAAVPPMLQPSPTYPTVLDLALPKIPRSEPSHPLLQPQNQYFCSPIASAALAAAMPKVLNILLLLLLLLLLYIGLVGLVATCSPRDPRFSGSNPAEFDGFFRT